MAGGEVCFAIFNKVAPIAARETRTDVPPFNKKECCFKLPVFADLAAPDDIYRNDKHSIKKGYDSNYYTSVTMFVQKWVDGDWQDQFEVTNDDYGNRVITTNSDSSIFYFGFIADFNLILDAFGEGTYRFEYRETDYISTETTTTYPFDFCLKTYNENLVNFSVRFETYTNGIGGDVDSDLTVFDYRPLASQNGGEWFNQWRLPQSFFGYNKSSYEREFIRYQNGQEVWLQDEQIESYTWNSGFYPALLHDYIKTDILQSDNILVSDYNSNNPNVIKNKAVNVSSNYEPNWQYNNKKAFVDVDFTQEYQNRRKKRC